MIPALLPGNGGFSYGVPYIVAQAMAERVIHEKRERFDSFSPELRRAKIQKQVDELKQAATKVWMVQLDTSVLNTSMYHFDSINVLILRHEA